MGVLPTHYTQARCAQHRVLQQTGLLQDSWLKLLHTKRVVPTGYGGSYCEGRLTPWSMGSGTLVTPGTLTPTQWDYYLISAASGINLGQDSLQVYGCATDNPSACLGWSCCCCFRIANAGHVSCLERPLAPWRVLSALRGTMGCDHRPSFKTPKRVQRRVHNCQNMCRVVDITQSDLFTVSKKSRLATWLSSQAAGASGFLFVTAVCALLPHLLP